MKTEETTITPAGVLRCCLATVALEHLGEDVEAGEKSACQHCKEPFTLTPEWKWVPDWQIKQDEENKTNQSCQT